MATAEELGRYIIESRADSILGEVSNEFSGLIVEIASHVTAERDSHGLPVITVCAVAKASEILCTIITEGVTAGRIPTGTHSDALLQKLKEFCARVTKECSADAQPSGTR